MIRRAVSGHSVGRMTKEAACFMIYAIVVFFAHYQRNGSLQVGMVLRTRYIQVAALAENKCFPLKLTTF